MSCLILHPIDLFYFTCMMIDRASCVRYGLVCAVSFLQRNWGHLTDDIEAGALVGQHIDELDLSALQPSSRRRGTYPLFWLVSAAT